MGADTLNPEVCHFKLGLSDKDVELIERLCPDRIYDGILAGISQTEA